MKSKKIKVIYNCRDIVMLQVDYQFVVCTHFQGVDAETGRILGDDLEVFANPLEAFTYWDGRVYSEGRKRIGEWLKQQGRNPLTGELDPDIIAEKCERIKKDR